MQAFNPPTILAHSPSNSFTTLSQPFPVSTAVAKFVPPSGASAETQGATGIWETEPWRTEQGITLEVPIFYKQTNGTYLQTTLQDYQIDNISDPFSTKNVVCHWVTPPYQTVGGDQNIDNPTHIDVGVIAFHASGKIDRVEFFLNGASNDPNSPTRIIVAEPSHHPDHDVTAYWIRIDNTSGLEDSGDSWTQTITESANSGRRTSGVGFKKQHELQAVVYPKSGKPRVLVGKHDNADTGLNYNSITPYWENSQTRKRVLAAGDSPIRSLYFSSNFNNTLFQGSVFIDPVNGVDNLSRSGTQLEPMKTIEFGFRKLGLLKFSFYNPLSPPQSEFNDAEVGGGVVYLMSGSHPMGYKTRNLGSKIWFSLTRADGTTIQTAHKTISRMRWITVTPAPGVTPLQAKLVGFHYQPFPSVLPTSESDFSKTDIRSSFRDTTISTTLQRYKNCILESGWPYSEYLFGIGPDLSKVGDIGNGQKLVKQSNWKIKKGVLNSLLNVETDPNVNEGIQEHSLFRISETSRGAYQYAVSSLNVTPHIFVPPRVWFDSCSLNGLVRDRQKIYDWANSLGMTYTTTSVSAPNFKQEQDNIQNWPNSKKGVFSALTNAPLGDGLEIQNDPELIPLTTPRIFVMPTEETMRLTNGLGFTLGVGYTFEFCWAHPEFSGTRADVSTQFIIPTTATNTLIENVEEPGRLSFNHFVNSTLSRYEADVFRATNTLVYQPFLLDGFISRNYLDNGDLFSVHSDVMQTQQGRRDFFIQQIGVNGFIFYRFNNPSPRSKRYSDPVARHGVPGVGPLTDIVFTSQWNISGRSDSSPPTEFKYDSSKWPEGDGKIYEVRSNKHIKDLVFQDCLIFTEDGTQQLLFTSLHENLIIRNTQLHGNAAFNASTEPIINFSANQIPTFGAITVRYKDAVPDNQTLNSNNDDVAEGVLSCFDSVLIDNVQQYKTALKNGVDNRIGSYNEPLIVFVAKGAQLSNNPQDSDFQRIGIRGPTRPKPFGHSLYGNKRFVKSHSEVTSDLRYPFERDSNGNAGPNQTVGGHAKIAFITFTDRYNRAVQKFINLGNPTPQPNSSTRGEWFTYHKTIPASTTSSDAPYGWVHSEIPYENFIYGRLPHPSGTQVSSKNAAIQAVDPTFLIKKNKPDGNGGLTWGTTIFDSRASLGTGYDPTFGTGKLNPQPTDAGFCANQRGFRESVFFTFTNFDFDATRSEFGEVLTPDRLPLLSGESGTGGTGNQQNGTPPTPISNHPITLRLSTTDITKEMSWSRKDHLDNSAGTTHGPDGIYPSSDLIQIPNYLERIEEVTDPNGSPEIGPSVNTEIIGNSTQVGNQGGVYVTGGVADFTLDTTVGKMNSIDITNISTIYLNKARKNNGLTMSLILHGKSVPGTSMAEFKYIAAPVPELDVNNQEINEGDVDLSGDHYEDFYKKFAYIAFNSRESQVTQSITSNQFSFRKSPHHTFVQFNRAEIDGISQSNALNGTTIFDMVLELNPSKLQKIQTLVAGVTCLFNSYTTANESTSATRDGTGTPQTITCVSKNLEYLGSDPNGNQIRFKNRSSGSSLFENSPARFFFNGPIAAFSPTFGNQAQTRFFIPAPPPFVAGEDPQPEPTINLRFINPITLGSKNLLGYKVANGVRLFGGTNNIGITAGSYIRISGSPNNNGIYQVKNIFDGIDGDTASNTLNGGLSEFQYLELSRAITVQQQSNTNITVENVSHLPILHIKYRQPL